MLGHTKRHCNCDACDGPHMCRDLDKHENKKKGFTEASQNFKAINREFDKLRKNLSPPKKKFKRKMFFIFRKVLPHLVNTNVEKYYQVGMYGLRFLRMGAIHPDLAIPETHFFGRVPLNIEKASKEFHNILKEKNFGITVDLKRIRCVYRWRKRVSNFLILMFVILCQKILLSPWTLEMWTQAASRRFLRICFLCPAHIHSPSPFCEHSNKCRRRWRRK